MKLYELRKYQDTYFSVSIRRQVEFSGLPWHLVATECRVSIKTAMAWGNGEKIPNAKQLIKLDKFFNN